MKASDQIAAKLPKLAAPKAVRARRRKPGLLHSMRSVNVEDVSAAMKKPCATCGAKPKVRRLVVGSGGGRYGKEDVYCITHGMAFLQKSEAEYRRAWGFLQRGFIPQNLRTDPENESEGIRL